MMNQRSLKNILFYVVGVSFICLMVEVRRRTNGDYYGLDRTAYAQQQNLDQSLYHVETANPKDLEKDPAETLIDLSANEVRGSTLEDDVIPKRNRGKEKWGPKRVRQKSFSSSGLNKQDFQKWKAEQERNGVNMKGMFKIWKKQQQETGSYDEIEENMEANSGRDQHAMSHGEDGLNDDEKDMAAFRKWKLSLDKSERSEKGLYKFWKAQQQNKKRPQTVSGSGASLTGKDDDVLETEENKEDTTNEPIEISNQDLANQDAAPEEDVEDKSDDDDDYNEGEEDYPSGMTRYQEADPEHSCVNFEMTEELENRSQDVKESCERLGEEIGQDRRLFSRLRWAVNERLLYCPVFKAASTTWLVNYLKLSKSKADPKVGNLHTRITNLFPPPATFKLRKKIYEESIKFIIVRHPFERLVSAYRDKLAGFTRNPHYLAMRKQIIETHRRNESDTSLIPTFRESVNFVLDELKKMELGSSKIIIDGHFIPYTRRCMPCSMDYDVVIKFESLEEDSNYLIQQCGLADRLQIKHENPAPTGPKTEQGYKNKAAKGKKSKSKDESSTNPEAKLSSREVTLKYFLDVPLAKIKELYKHYRFDFEIFGYSADEYYEQAVE